MPSPRNTILLRMLDRLYAGLASGPNLNCRPHSSRQRVDWMQFLRLRDLAPAEILRELVDGRSVRITARVPPPKSPGRPEWGARRSIASEAITEEALTTEDPSTRTENSDRTDWIQQQALLTKLRALVEDSREYLQDTGVHVLHVGFPLLSLPVAGGQGGLTVSRRLLAPIAFIPVSVEIRSGAAASVLLQGLHDGADFVTPNEALFSWLERQAGPAGAEVPSQAADSDPADRLEESADIAPWQEILELTRRVARMVHLDPDKYPRESLEQLAPAPRGDERQMLPEIVPAAVLGLFPMNNQGLLRDTQALIDDPAPFTGPLQRFLTRMDSQAQPPADPAAGTVPEDPVQLVSAADPCQVEAVRLSRSAEGLVVHGPPGTGKSQTITNMIGDHLARGERVLLVCDKRTALDVVARRLEHLGLGSLCALIHDPQRDQKPLYKAIREQLEGLSDQSPQGRSDALLKTQRDAAQAVQRALRDARSLVMDVDSRRQVSFHERMGSWLSSADPAGLHAARTQPFRLEHLQENSVTIREIVIRALRSGYREQPWCIARGLTLEHYLCRPVHETREKIEAWRLAARAVDAAPRLSCEVGPIAPGCRLAHLIERRGELLKRLHRALSVDANLRRRLLSVTPASRLRIEHLLVTGNGAWSQLQSFTSEPTLERLVASWPVTAAELAARQGQLNAYVDSCQSWNWWLRIPTWFGAQRLLRQNGLDARPDSARRLAQAVMAVRARAELAAVLEEILGTETARDELSLRSAWDNVTDLVGILRDLESENAPLIAQRVQASLEQGDADVLSLLKADLPRLTALAELQQLLETGGLVNSTWSADLMAAGMRGDPLCPRIDELADNFDGLEEVLRIDAGLEALGPVLSDAVRHGLARTGSLDDCWAFLEHEALGHDLTDWVRTEPRLGAMDPVRLGHLHNEAWRLEQERQPVVREHIRDRWLMRQRSRLLALTGSRLNSLGADLRRRLTLRGERAMRLRQVLTVGDKIDGGDPIFDLRPVWMASPETVAQIFPRKALFDVVIFDEASQCRLEEALPVLTRGRRVVIAGDPQQLPPTRFFESAAVSSGSDAVDSDEDLFESHQRDVEDLLTAALSLDLDECYLDVHYRSRHADLVSFSNARFYGSRLQAIPSHPLRVPAEPPITLHAVAGVYEYRQNPAEADEVCRIVARLLSQDQPPSIGIACFNLTQRDLILDALESRANEDAEFGSRLAVARERSGSSAFEGLFVKNLENVQGDERDHMIISTTYGPDPAGRFYQRFGPLGQAGGGRRLNVLVTRAREHVHLVTSIPASVYRQLPEIPAGQNPGGGWLLLDYLAHAERLQGTGVPTLMTNDTRPPGGLVETATRTPSLFAAALGRLIASRSDTWCDVHWGNEGFCIDLAFHHPGVPADRTLGVVCDGTRYQNAADPVAWDVFRTAVLQQQGWRLERLWTPQFFRDPEGTLNQLLLRHLERTTESRPADGDGVATGPG